MKIETTPLAELTSCTIEHLFKALESELKIRFSCAPTITFYRDQEFFIVEYPWIGAAVSYAMSTSSAFCSIEEEIESVTSAIYWNVEIGDYECADLTLQFDYNGRAVIKIKQ